MSPAELLQRATKCAPIAVTRYLRGHHIPPRTRALLETARIRLGLPPVPLHARCPECVSLERAERKSVIRSLRSFPRDARGWL